MSTPRSFYALTPRTLALGAGLAALMLAAAAPAAAQYRDHRPPAQAYASYGSYGQSYGRADSRVVVTYGQPSPYDYGYSYPRTGAAGAVYEGETRVYAATGAAATGQDGYGYYGDTYYQPPRAHDGYAYRYRQRHDSYGRTHDRGYDRGGRYGYSGYQGYRDEYGYQDDRPRSAPRRDRYDDRRDRRYDRHRDCDCSDVYMYDR